MVISEISLESYPCRRWRVRDFDIFDFRKWFTCRAEVYNAACARESRGVKSPRQQPREVVALLAFACQRRLGRPERCGLVDDASRENTVCLCFSHSFSTSQKKVTCSCAHLADAFLCVLWSRLMVIIISLISV